MINPNELTYGSKVHYDSDIIYEIVSVDGSHVDINVDDENGDIMVCGIPINEIRPVKITIEYLIKKGFTKRGDRIGFSYYAKEVTGDTKFFRQDDKRKISMNEGCDNLFIDDVFIGHIQYLHELETILTLFHFKDI